MARPGIMVYFDIRENFELMTLEEIGSFVMAMLDYGEYGLLPEFNDRALKGTWNGVKKWIDADGRRYDRVCAQKAYAAYCKKAKRGIVPQIEYDEYLETYFNGSERTITDVNGQQPTINSQQSTISTQPSTISSQSSTVICQGANSQRSDYNGQRSTDRGQRSTQVKIDNDVLREVLEANRYKANYNK